MSYAKYGRLASVGRGVTEAAVVLVLSVLLGSGPARAGTGWQSFRHPSQGFSINYPAGWETLSGTGQIAFAAVGPAVGPPGTRMVLVVVAAPLPPGATLDDAESSIKASLARQGQTTNVLRQDRFSLRRIPALLVYLHRKNAQGVELYQMVMILTHRGRGYGVAGSTAAASPSLTEDTKLLQSILLTFKPSR